MSVKSNDVEWGDLHTLIKVYRSLDLATGDVSYFVMAWDSINRKPLFHQSCPEGKDQAIRLAVQEMFNFPT